MYERTRDNDVSLNGEVNKVSSTELHTETDARSNSFLCKVYGFMFIMLLITFVVAYALGLPLNMAMTKAIESGDAQLAEMTAYIYIGIIIAASIGLLVTSIIINIRAFTRKHSIKAPGIIYSVMMGVLLAGIVGVVNEVGSWIIPAVFAIVAMMFGIMYFISKFVKNIHWLGTIAISVGIGAGLMALTGVLLFFFVPQEFFFVFLLTEVLIFIFFIINFIFGSPFFRM